MIEYPYKQEQRRKERNDYLRDYPSRVASRLFLTGKMAEFQADGSLHLEFSSGDFIAVEPAGNNTYEVYGWTETVNDLPQKYEGGTMVIDKVSSVVGDIENDILGA